MNGEVLEEELLSSVKSQLPRLKSRGTRPQRHPHPLLWSLSLTFPQPGPRSSQQSLSHMGQERKPKGKQFPCRPQSNFCFRQSHAACRVTSAPPQGVLEAGDALGGASRSPGHWSLKSVSGRSFASLPIPPRRLWRAQMSALRADGFLVAQGG